MICPRSNDQILDTVVAQKKYEIGSSAKLSFGKKETKIDKVATVWKLSDENDDLINENDLLNDSDKVKPNPSELKGTKHLKFE